MRNACSWTAALASYFSSWVVVVGSRLALGGLLCFFLMRWGGGEDEEIIALFWGCYIYRYQSTGRIDLVILVAGKRRVSHFSN
jgi:hypothetical protein